MVAWERMKPRNPTQPVGHVTITRADCSSAHASRHPFSSRHFLPDVFPPQVRKLKHVSPPVGEHERYPHTVTTLESTFTFLSTHKLLMFLLLDSEQGPNEERLINTIFEGRKYNRLARPAAKEEDALEVKFGVALQQIVDVVCSV